MQVKFNSSVDDIIKTYSLISHPEGGYYKETYRSAMDISVLDRNYCTAIYYLLTKGAKSSLHKIKSDEIWHFYLGGSMTVAIIHNDGKIEEITLGQDMKAGQKLQYVVPANTWFGAYPNEGTEYSFVGCTVSPGFDFRDFELGKKQFLLKDFPHAKRIIEKLTTE